jgi:3'-phosphoadenosine 5'-phosphosulfate (PAPS) 3'-phosphatase
MKVSNPKPIRHETEKKTITTKFFLNQDDNRKMQNNSINANVNIINININNNNSSNNFNGNISSKNSSSLQTISDKEISYIIKQKLKQINQKKCDEKNQNQNENKKKDNSFKILNSA